MKKCLLFTYISAMTCLSALAGNPVFGPDVKIKDTTGVDQAHIRLTTAFNGWQYAAFSTFSGVTGGVTIRVSKDGGSTWQNIDSYSSSPAIYNSIDIVVAGENASSLTLFVAAVKQDLSANQSYLLYIDRYNANTGAYLGRVVSILDSMQIYDVAIASDYMSPGNVSNPYSVGALYSSTGASEDTITYIASTDSGATWNVNETVMDSYNYGGNYFGKVAIAYGKSLSGINGRYFGAWEMVTSPSNSEGYVFTSHNTDSVSGSWNAPVDLDSVTGVSGFVRNPSIATSISSTADNDSGGITAVVLADYDINGDGSDYDVIGFYNKVAHFSDFWFGLNVKTGAEYDAQPDIAYSRNTSTFFCTYYDSTDGHLPFVQDSLDLTNPNTWTSISAGYNDSTTGLTAPYPQVSANAFTSMASFAWIQNNGTNDQALFDQEGSTVSIPGQPKAISGITLFPNPAAHDITVSISLKSISHVRIDIYNGLGQVMLTEDLGALSEGYYNQQLNLDALANGNYFVKVTGDRFVETEKMVIAK